MKTIKVLPPTLPLSFMDKMRQISEENQAIRENLLDQGEKNSFEMHHILALVRLFVPSNFVMN